MLNLSWRQRLGAVAAAVMLAAIGSTPALAQDMFDRPVRIGAILPAPEPDDNVVEAAYVRQAQQGIVVAEEEFVFNADMLGIEMAVLRETATGVDETIAAAERLVNDEHVFALIGGFGLEETIALSTWADANNVPFLNVANSSDSLRGALCRSTTFHLEPSAAMYLDALAGWYVRSGFRRWYIVYEDTAEGRAEYDRLRWSMNNRHFGTTETGRMAIPAGAGIGDSLITAISRSRSDLVVLLTHGVDQVQQFHDLDAAGLDLQVAGYPDQYAQTRTFFFATREAAPRLGAQYRALSWEATLDAYGAREMNARYRARFNEPMDPIAWSTYQGVKVLYEAAFFSRSLEADEVVGYMTARNSVFDVYKGIGTSFRAWDRQLRQSLYLIKVGSTETDPFELGLLVGELPAIYMPGTDLTERLDQLGDLANRSACRR